MSSDEYKKSLVAVTSHNLMSRIQNLSEELLASDVDELEAEVKPTNKQKELKISIQNELNAAHLEGRCVKVSNFCRGVMSEAYFRKNIMTNKELLTWMLIPSTDSELKMKRIYIDSLNKVDKIMNDISIELDNCADSKERRALRDQYFKFFYTIAQRAAPAVQRQEIKKQEIPYQMPAQEPKSVPNDTEDRIKRLEEQLEKGK